MNSKKPSLSFRASLCSGIIILAIGILLFSCNEKEEFTSESINDYMPLAVGKYITYRIDSTVFTNFGRATEVHKYQVKHEINAQITDNQGRPAYRVYYMIRDSAGLLPWQQTGTYSITPLNDQLEVQEDNLRFIKLHMPINDGFSWKGNRYIPTNPYDPLYVFSNDDNIQDWDYYYDGDLSSFSYGGRNYSDVITVEQMDEAFNVPITTPSSYASLTRSVERYSKSIGLIFRQYELWEYQPNTGGPGGPYKTGFGITMWMIDHN